MRMLNGSTVVSKGYLKSLALKELHEEHQNLRINNSKLLKQQINFLKSDINQYHNLCKSNVKVWVKENNYDDFYMPFQEYINDCTYHHRLHSAVAVPKVKHEITL